MVFERKINYYETDQMGVVHHSNYIRFMEEARAYFMDKIGLPYKVVEENNMLIPVLKVKCEYKYPAKFGDTILIELSLLKFNGIRMEFSYKITNKENGNLIAIR